MDTEKEQIRLDSVSNFCLVCYYDNKTKELVRIEQYKDNSSDIQTDINSYKYGYNAEIIKPEELINQLVCKTQECEELRKTVLIKCPVCNSKYLTPIGLDLYKENALHRNALKKIEEIVKGMRSVFIEEISITANQLNDRIYQESTARFRQILDIINKVKGTDNV